MNSRLREQATKLRLEKELSYGEIKKRLNVAESTLSYWLREFPLTEEKIKVQLYLYENMNVGQENRYQSNGRIAQLVRAPN